MMQKNDSLSSNQIQIINIGEGIYQNETFYNSFVKDYDYFGYLIDYRSIEDIKKKIKYEKIKPLLIGGKNYDKYKKEIKETQEKIKEIIPKQYKCSKELITELINDNKSFYLIKQEYFHKIITDKNKITGSEIKFKFHNDNIILIFNENDALNFSYNKDGILKRTLLMEANLSSNIPGKDNKKVTSESEINKEPNNKIKFNKDLEILVNIFYYNKYLKEKKNDALPTLNNENGETVYLIHNSWMEEYKSFFDYKSLENYLDSKKEYSDLIVQNNDYIIFENKIKQIIESLPVDYINKINKNPSFDKEKNFKYEYNKIKNGENYLCNNHILNSKTYQLLNEQKYKLNEPIKNFTLYFVGLNKILLYSNENGSNKDVDEIGTINDKGIFIPEYLLKYKEDKISLDDLNIILKNDLFNFYLDDKNESWELKIKNEIQDKQYKQVKVKEIGYCYKIENNNITANIDNNGEPEGNNLIKERNHNDINNNQTQTQNNPANSTLTSQTHTKEDESNNQEKEINPYIELMINIYLLKDELKNKVNRELKNSFEERYYIINKKLMDELKLLFGYDNKFLNYLNSGNINDIINKYNPKDKYIEFLSEIKKIFNDDYINEINSKIIDDKIKDIKSLYTYSNTFKEKNNIFYFANDIEIINEKIKNIIQRIFNIEIGEKKVFLFGDDRIIMSVEYQEQNSLMIGNYNKNYYFEKDLLLNFYTKLNLENCIKSFTDNGYNKTMNTLLNPQVNNKDIYLKDDSSNTIGQLYKINEENNIASQAEYNNSNNNNNTNPNNQTNPNQKINNKIELNNKFLENQIKALISYYLFSEKLSQNIQSSKILNLECYFIEENWMKKYTNFLFYEDIKTQIKNGIIVEKEIEKIYEKLSNEYLKKIKDNEKQICKDINENKSTNELDIFESGNINDIIKYYAIKFYIIDKETYEYMNLDLNKKVIFAKNKDCIINNGKILINLLVESLTKFEILICSLNIIDNLLIPELLYKYYSKVIMINDFNLLKKNEFIKYVNNRTSPNNNELIKKNNNNKEKIGIIYNLKSSNLLELINKNNPNKASINKNQKNNNANQNGIKQYTEIKQGQASKLYQREINSKETQEILKARPPTNIQKGSNQNDYNGRETMKVLNALNQNQCILDDTKKYHVEFLLRYFTFEQNLNVKINSPYTFNIFRENGYIINYQIIQLYEEFYQSNKFFGFFKNDPNLNKIYQKYWNQAKYLASHDEEKFINESLQNLPKDYIKEIQEKNNSQFLYNLQNSALYKPLINYVQNNQQYYYFNNSVLLNEYLGNFILSFLHEQNVIQKVQYIINICSRNYDML